MQYLGMYPNITPLPVELAKEMRENISTVLRNMLDRLEPGEDMSVYHFTGAEIIKVAQLIFRGTNLVLIVGEDAGGHFTISMRHLDDVNLTCKIVKMAPDEKRRTPIGFVYQDDPKAQI